MFSKHIRLRKRRHHQFFLSSASDLSGSTSIRKLRFAKLLFPNHEIEAELPQNWVTKMNALGFDVEPHFVVVTTAKNERCCLPITAAGIAMLISYSKQTKGADCEAI